MARLTAWSHDERLGDGMLLREAVLHLERAVNERDEAIKRHLLVAHQHRESMAFTARALRERDRAMEAAHHCAELLAEQEKNGR